MNSSKDGLSETEFAARIETLGFPSPLPVRSLRSIAHHFGGLKPRCGIYVLVFEGSQIYIGQAIEVVRRFAQHRQNYGNIVAFSFIAVVEQRLDQVEVESIRKAESLGLVLLNTVHASTIVGETDLDFVVSEAEQAAWLRSPIAINLSDRSQPITLPDQQISRFAAKFSFLSVHPLAVTALALLRAYIRRCLPFPRRTEYSFWSISCMPATNRSTWPRLASVNLALMEAFVLGYLKNRPAELWGFINVASDTLLGAFGTEYKFRRAFPHVELIASDYRDAGQFQWRLHTEDEATLFDLLNNETVCQAAGMIALRVMRKRATIYGRFHCKQLANQILAE